MFWIIALLITLFVLIVLLWPFIRPNSGGDELIAIERQEQNILDHEPDLQNAIALRNPYVDPMSLLQVDLLRRWRASNRQDKDLQSALHTTVRGIARGMQNAG